MARNRVVSHKVTQALVPVVGYTIAVTLPMVDQGNMFRQANNKATPFPVSTRD